MGYRSEVEAEAEVEGEQGGWLRCTREGILEGRKWRLK